MEILFGLSRPMSVESKNNKLYYTFQNRGPWLKWTGKEWKFYAKNQFEAAIMAQAFTAT